MAKATDNPIKFIVEYRDESGKITDRWHYDYGKTKAGPILVENLDLPRKEKRKKVAKTKK